MRGVVKNGKGRGTANRRGKIKGGQKCGRMGRWKGSREKRVRSARKGKSTTWGGGLKHEGEKNEKGRKEINALGCMCEEYSKNEDIRLKDMKESRMET